MYPSSFQGNSLISIRKRNDHKLAQNVVGGMLLIATLAMIVISRKHVMVECNTNDAMHVHGSFQVDPSFQISHGHRKSNKLGLARNPNDPLPSGRPSEVKLEHRAYNRLMVIPEYKLIFCYIEKVGCSMFNQLFRLLRIFHPSLSQEERAYLAGSHFGRAKPEHFNMTASQVSQLIADPEWTKAVFFRDPADRFLSGFKSKCGLADDDGGRHCRGAFGHYKDVHGYHQPILGGDPSSFRQAIEMAWNGTHSVFANHHFKLSADFCGGLDNTIDHYNFVHLLDKDTVRLHVKDLFEHIGVDEKLSGELLDRVVNTGGALHPVDVEKVRKEYGLVLRGNISKSHNTVNDKMSDKDYFGSTEVLQKLHKAYARDYEMFQLEPPRFEDL